MGEYFVLRDSSIFQRLIAIIRNLGPSDPPLWDVEIKKHVKNKTSQQRRYFHKVLDLVCDYTGDDVEEVKMAIKYRVLPLSEITVDGEKHLYPLSSERATVSQYSDLITAALMFAAEAGVDIPPPHYYGFEIHKTPVSSSQREKVDSAGS